MLLNGRLELHGVDAEGLVRKALDDALRTRGIHLRPHEHADAVAFLVAECWRLSVAYDPARTSRFSTFAYRRLRLLVWDWHRREYGRTKWAFGNATSTNGRDPTFSTSTVPGEIDWSALSEQGKATARRIALPLSMGYTVWEVAQSIGITRSSVERLVGELRNELERDATR